MHHLWPALTQLKFPLLKSQEGLVFLSQQILSHQLSGIISCTCAFHLQIIEICRWSFSQSADAIRKQEFSDTLPRASVTDLGVILMGAGYEVIIHAMLVIILNFTPHWLTITLIITSVTHIDSF